MAQRLTNNKYTVTVTVTVTVNMVTVTVYLAPPCGMPGTGHSAVPAVDRVTFSDISRAASGSLTHLW